MREGCRGGLFAQENGQLFPSMTFLPTNFEQVFWSIHEMVANSLVMLSIVANKCVSMVMWHRVPVNIRFEIVEAPDGGGMFA